MKVRIARLMVVVAALIAFGVAGVVVAADPGEFYVTKDAAGKVSIVDKKPADAKSIVSGPYKTKDEADKASKAAGTAKKPVKLPDQGC